MTFEEACLLRIARQFKREVDEFRSLLRRNREIKAETESWN